MHPVINLRATTSKYRNVLGSICCLGDSIGAFESANARSHTSIDVQATMKRSLEAGDAVQRAFANAPHVKRVGEKQIDVDRPVRSETVKAFDDVVCLPESKWKSRDRSRRRPLGQADAAAALPRGFGIIAKLEQGAHSYFAQTRLPDGRRLPSLVHVVEDSVGK